MAHDDGAPRRPPPPRPDPVHQRVIDFDVTTSEEERDEARQPARGNWTTWLLLMAVVVLAAAVWMVSRIPLEPVPIRNWSEMGQNLSTEFIPWYWPVGFVALTVGFILVMLIFFPRAERSENAYWGQAADRRRDVPAIDA